MCTQKVEQVHDLDRMREGRKGEADVDSHAVSSLVTWLSFVLLNIYLFSG